MEKIIVLGHDNPDVDSIVSGYLLDKLLKHKGYNSEFVIPDNKINEESLNICKEYGLDANIYKRDLTDEDKNFILVDHNEREINGNILAIIDHHITTKEPSIERYYNKSISSTSCYICQGSEEIFDDNDLTLAFVAAMVDTASFHSTKGREEDKNWIINLCKERNINYEKVYETGLCLTDLSDLNVASLNGLKHYNICDKEVEASYVQLRALEEKKEIINEIISNLKEYRQIKELDMFVFIVYDMDDFLTIVYKITYNNIEIVNYNEYAPRGNKIILDIEKDLSKK